MTAVLCAIGGALFGAWAESVTGPDMRRRFRRWQARDAERARLRPPTRIWGSRP